MSKIIKYISVFTIVLICCVFFTTRFSASAVQYESENNNYYSKANVITLGSTICGSTSSHNDYDYYKFTLTGDCKVDISFSHDKKSNGSSWGIEILKLKNDDTRTTIIDAIVSASSGTYNFSPLGLAQGDYLIYVWDENFYNHTDGVEYRIAVNATSTNIWETEFNNVYYNADTLTLNTTKYGNMINSSDYDYYQFTLTKDSVVDISFLHDKKSNGSSWGIEVLKLNSDETRTKITEAIISASSGIYNFSSLGLPIGDYLIYVWDDNFYNHTDGIKYGITVNATETALWETEFNNVYYQADPLIQKTAKYGNMTNSSDLDYYSFTLTKDATVNISFCHDKKSNGSSWSIEIMRLNGDETRTKINSAVVSASSGNYVFDSLNLSKGNYLVLIQDDNYYNHTDGINYNLLVTPKPHKVKGLKSMAIKVAKSSEITLTWSEVSGAEKYEIQQYKSGKWKRIKTTSKTSYTVKKLKADKKYKFRVRAVAGDLKGKYSSTLTVKTIPETTSLKLKAGKKQLTASWSKVSGISGYEVQYSTSKKFTTKTTKTVKVKKSSKKTTIKKLKKGKKHYVRIRTYKTVNGKKIYSGWSKVKNVKVK